LWAGKKGQKISWGVVAGCPANPVGGTPRPIRKAIAHCSAPLEERRTLKKKKRPKFITVEKFKHRVLGVKETVLRPRTLTNTQRPVPIHQRT